MADEIKVYNLDDQKKTDIYNLSSSDTGTTVNEASPIALTEQDVRNLILEILQSYDGEIRLGAQLADQALIIDSQGIRLGGTDFASAQFSVDMDGVMTAQAGTFSGTVNVGELHVPDEDATANSAHIDTAGNSWWGATTTSFTANNDNAPAYVLKNGSAKFQNILIGDETDGKFLSYNAVDDELYVEGRTAYQATLTAGVGLAQGNVCAIESDGKIYPTRATGLEGTTASSTASSGSGRTSANTGLAGISQDVAVQIIQESSTLYYQRVVVDIDVPEVTSISTSSYTTSGTTQPDIARLTSTSALVVSQDGSQNIYGQVFTGLDSGVTTNSETTIDTDAVTPRIAGYDDTSALLVYKENSTGDIKARSITISGTTVSAGAEVSVHTQSSGTSIQSLVRFGNSDDYCLAVHDGSVPWLYPINYDGSTITVGTWKSQLGSLYSATAAGRQPTIASVDDTRVVVTVLDNQSAKAVVVSVSGTTLTEGTPITFDTVASAASNDGIFALGMGDVILTAYISDSNTDLDGQLLQVTGTSIAALGSQYTIGTVSSSAPMNTSRDIPIAKLSPEWVMFSWESGTNTDNFEIRKMDTNFSSAVGVVAEAIAEDASGRVVLSGYSDDFTGLTAGDDVYADLAGSTTTYDKGGRVQVGIALSSTTMKIKI